MNACDHSSFQIIQEELIELYLMVKNRAINHDSISEKKDNERLRLRKMELGGLIQYIKASIEIVLEDADQ